MIGAIVTAAMVFTAIGEPTRAAEALPRGTVLEEWHLTTDDPDALAPLVGMALKRPVQEGGVVTPAHVEPVPAIRRSEPVRIVFRRGAIELVLEGEALRDAAVGERAMVTVGGRHRPLYGRVSGLGEVRVP